uniref:Uncharacterized protein n=1 Tax=Pseudonaja textilis TaxID=8673 RepID=A0A670ZDZ8_PSETE
MWWSCTETQNYWKKIKTWLEEITKEQSEYKPESFLLGIFDKEISKKGTVLTILSFSFYSRHYLIIFPAFIHHPSMEKFCIFLDSFSKSIHVSVTLEMKLQNHTLLDKDANIPGTFECTSFQLSSPAHPRITTFENRKKVLVKNAHERTLIELDKPFYKPGEEEITPFLFYEI